MLARQPQGEMVLVGDIAKEQSVPKKFLELILLELRKHGLLFSQRGRGGGYTLARPPESITFGQVIRIVDGPVAPPPLRQRHRLPPLRRLQGRADLRDPARARRDGGDPRR